MTQKVMTFKLSADDETHRTIEIHETATLFDLAEIILESLDFDCDHAFGFFSNPENLYESDEVYELFADLPGTDVEPNVGSVKKTKLVDVFQPKKKMAMLFDYGDEWIFLVECTKAGQDAEAKTAYPRITEKVGESPEQYPDYDEEEEVEEVC
jgi:hypothetical protein